MNSSVFLLNTTTTPMSPVILGPNSNESRFSIFYNSYNLHSLESSTNDSNITAENLSLGNNHSDHIDVVKFLFQGVFITTISVLGILGNIFTILVLSNRRMRSSISCFLIGLAVCDILTLISSLLLLGLPTLISFTKTEATNPSSSASYLKFAYLVPIFYAGSCTAITGSVYFTLAVTLERYIAVCKPFLSRSICTWRRACQFSICILAFSIIFNLPRWWHYKCVTVYDPNDNSTVLGCRPESSELRQNLTYDFYYIRLGYVVFHYLFPVCCLVIINALIYLQIREANKNRKTLTLTEQKENSLAYMLFIVVAVFIVCNTSIPVLFICQSITGKTIDASFQFIGIFLVCLNSSLNFLIYCVYGEKFREVFIDMICFRKKITRTRQGSDLSNSLDSGKSHQSIQRRILESHASIKTICENV